MMNGENHENFNTRWYTFLGRAFVEEALQRGHEVTSFNREQTKKFFLKWSSLSVTEMVMYQV